VRVGVSASRLGGQWTGQDQGVCPTGEASDARDFFYVAWIQRRFRSILEAKVRAARERIKLNGFRSDQLSSALIA
jgi:hypothetical protein